MNSVLGDKETTRKKVARDIHGHHRKTSAHIVRHRFVIIKAESAYSRCNGYQERVQIERVVEERLYIVEQRGKWLLIISVNQRSNTMHFGECMDNDNAERAFRRE